MNKLKRPLLSENEPPPDHLNAIGVLARREIEARIIGPLLEALGAEFGPERVLEIVRQVIVGIAREQGAQLAGSMGGNSLSHFADSMDAWKKGDAMDIEVLEQTDKKFLFNVKRCGYADLYQDLGMPELGSILSCSRDHALIEGFNPDVKLTRTQTILQGAPICDFRYVIRKET